MALQAFQQRKYYYDFDPRSIGACIGWYDANDSNTIIYDTSGAVEAWLDKSGTNRHLTQSNVNLRPGFRRSGIDISIGLQRFDTSGFPQRLYEVFVMGTPDVSATTGNTLFHSGNNQRIVSMSNGFPGGTVWIKTPVQAPTGTWAGLPNAPQPTLISMNMRNDLIATFRMNGSQSTTTPTFTTRADLSYIGNEATISSPWGIINEMIVYNNFLTFKQRRLVEGYLAHKWRSTNVLQQPPTGFAPTDISGCSVWLDADDDTQFDLSGSASNSVWVWRDKAGNRWDFSQNTLANRPTYISNDNYKYVNFVAASQQTLLFNRTFLSNAVYNRAFSFFSVVTRNSANTNNCFFGATVNASRNQLIAGWRSGILGVDFNGDNATGSAGDTVTSNSLVNPTVVYFEHFGSPSFVKNVFSNGLLIVRRTPGGSNLLGGTNQSIGIANLGATGTPYYEGRVCEVIFYDRVLSTDDQQKVHGYLFDKWHKPPITPFVYPNHEARLVRNPVVRDFRPSDIRNCVLWLDAADPTSYTLDSNNVLISWIDKSSNRNNPDICGNPVYALHPSNQKYGFYFNQPSFARGNTQLGSNIYTLFLAASIDASGATRGRIFGVTGRQDVSDFDDVSGVTMIAKTSTSNRICYLKGSATSERAPCDSSWNTPNVMIQGYDTYFFGTGQQMAHNNGVRGGTSARTPTVFAPTKYTLMGSPGCNYQDNGNGYVFETIMYNGFLSYSEMDQIQTYLGRKWGIDISSALYIANVPPVSIGERPNAVSLDAAFATQQFNCILWLDAMDSNTYTVSNNVITRLESKGVYGGSLTTSLGATYLPGYDATGINGRPCFTTATTNPGARLYGSFGYGSVGWGGVRNQHTVIMVVQPTSNIDASFGRLFSCWGGAGNDSTTGSGFAIATSNTTSPFTITPLRFSSMPLSTSNIIPYRTPLTLTQGTPTIISYNGQNDGGNMTPTTWAIGSVANAPTATANTWELKVGEVFMFQFAPSATETQAIEGYLARKWGIDLSDNHTYKYVRP